MRYQKLKQIYGVFKPYLSPRLQKSVTQVWRRITVLLTAILEHRKILEIYRIVSPVEEVADFKRSKILGPTVNEVLVEVSFTAMSPGTERAQLLRLPGVINPWEEFYPGYSGSGIVEEVGNNITSFQSGNKVAGRIKHGSKDVVQESWLFHVPESVKLEEAALIELGIIVLQGIRKAHIQPGESILVLGQGLIGQLANRLSRVAGGAPIVAVARTSLKASHSIRNGGADIFLPVEELNREIIGEGFDVVIEATGDPNALALANSLACSGGRIILLGTARGLGNINLGQNNYQAGLTLIGTHISGMPQMDQSWGLWTYRQEGQLFLDLLAKHRLVLDDLVNHQVDPSQANKIYEMLKTGDSKLISVLFDWTGYTS